MFTIHVQGYSGCNFSMLQPLVVLFIIKLHSRIGILSRVCFLLFILFFICIWQYKIYIIRIYAYLPWCYDTIITNFEKPIDFNLFHDNFLVFVTQINPTCRIYDWPKSILVEPILDFALKLLSAKFKFLKLKIKLCLCGTYLFL